jgi:hypothetical protein
MVRPLLAAVAVCLSTAAARADLITFETRPAGTTPVDNTNLGNPYNVTGGTVRFFFDVNGNNSFDSGVDVLPVFEARGNADADPQGFVSTKTGGQDNPAAGNLGNWFVRQPQGIGPLPGAFVIDYDVTQVIDALSGEIWDIDSAANGTERWQVDVLDDLGNVIATQLSPVGLNVNDPNSLDSLPWVFSFSGLAALSDKVDKVRLTFVGTKTDGIGLSFNNYDAFDAAAPAAVPGPAALTALAIGLAGLIVGRRFVR